VRRFLLDFPDKTIAIVSVDPSKRKTGGALLGDRIRMNAINNPRVYMRSLATRQSNLALSKYVHAAVDILKAPQNSTSSSSKPAASARAIPRSSTTATFRCM
jgi:methylmalonyl-CoA mutase